MKTTIGVCIATYLRPVMLADLLRSIGELVVDSARYDIVIVVVDNDASGSARGVVERVSAGLAWRTLYAIEPTRNIARVRNKTVAMALAEGADFLAFVDDDERVTATWLAELLRVQSESEADIVGGSVVNTYEAGAPAWMVKSGLPMRGRVRTGRTANVPATSNAFVSRRVFTMLPQHFDERFGRTGGSDSHLFLRARLAGATTAWADDAVVHETMPLSRSSARWLLRRAFRVGNTAVLVARAELPVVKWLPRRAAAALYRLGRGVILLLPAVPRGRAAIVLALQDICLGAGALAGIAGYRVTEYDRTHGA